MSKQLINLQSVNGNLLAVDSSIELQIEIGGVKVNQKFYVVQNINRNIILGRDFLQRKGICLYHDLNCLCINNWYVPFEEDFQIASLVRFTSDQVVKPQSSCVYNGKIKENPDVSSSLYQLSAVDMGCFSNEPGLVLPSSVMRVDND